MLRRKPRIRNPRQGRLHFKNWLCSTRPASASRRSKELKAQTHQVASLRATIEQSRKRLAQITSSYRQQLQNERSDANGQRLRLEQEAGKAGLPP